VGKVAREREDVGGVIEATNESGEAGLISESFCQHFVDVLCPCEKLIVRQSEGEQAGIQQPAQDDLGLR
jgi:hypothetical protein